MHHSMREEATDIRSSKCLIKRKVTAVVSVVSTVVLPTQILLSIITVTLDLNYSPSANAVDHSNPREGDRKIALADTVVKRFPLKQEIHKTADTQSCLTERFDYRTELGKKDDN